MLLEEQPDFDSNYETSIDMLRNSDSSKNDKVIPTPLPFSQVVCVLLIQLCEAININVLFPFLAFMVEDLGHGGNMLGVYAGGLGAAFCFAQFSSSIIWGIVSDHYGRKPAIIIGTIGAALGMIVFGFSVTYWQAVLGRSLSGFLSGNLGVLKTYLTEITDDSNRGYGFSLMSLSWSIGTIIAPLAGGWLCKPAEKYPTIFPPNGLFGKFPYLLPSLVCVTFSAISVVSCLVLMKDPVKREINDKQPSKSNPFFLLTSKRRKGLSNQVYSPISIDDKDPDLEQSNDLEIEKSLDNNINDNTITSKEKESNNGIIDEEDETLPLYLKLDKLQGGFSFSSTEIGILLSCGGLLTMVYQSPLLGP
eukprot:gene17496-23052_t